MDPQDIINYLRERARKSGATSEVDLEDGRFVFKNPFTGEKSSTLPAAEAALKKMGLTSRRNYAAKLGATDMQMGTMHSSFLEGFQSALGSNYEVNFTTWKLSHGNIDEFNARFFNRRTGQYTGFVIPDVETTGIVQVKKGSKFLSHEEIYGLMENNLHAFAGAGGKVTKRLRGLVNAVPYSDFSTQSLSAYVFNPEDMNAITSPTLRHLFRSHMGDGVVDIPGLAASDVAKHSFDGAVWMHPDMIDRMGNAQIDRAVRMAKPYVRLSGDYNDVKGMIDTLRATAGGSPEDTTIINNALHHLEQVQELRRSVESGSPFNLRAYGLNADEMLAKGNVWALDRGIAGQLTDELGQFDFIGSTDNFKVKEAGLVGDINTYWTLDPRHGSGGKPVYLDIDTMLTHQDFYNADGIIQYNKDQFRRYVGELANGEVPGGMRNALERYVPDILPGDMASNIAMQSKQGWFAHLSMMNKYGIPVDDNPMFMRQLYNTYVKGMDRDGVPRIQIPDAIRGYVTSEEVFSATTPGQRMAAQGRKIGDWAIDQIGDTTVIGGREAAATFEAFGGFDFDDSLVQMLRWDEKQGALKAIVFRQPTGIGEQMVFDVAKDSNIVRSVLRGREDDAAQDWTFRRDQYDADIARNQQLVESQALRVGKQMEIDRLEAELDDDLTRQIDDESFRSRLDHHQMRRRINRLKRDINSLTDKEIGIRKSLVASGGLEALDDAPDIAMARAQAGILSMQNELSRLFTHHANTDEILARSVAYEHLPLDIQERIARNTGTAVGEGGMLKFFQVNQEFEDNIKAAQRARAAQMDNMPYDSRFVREQMELMADTTGKLGSYTNARIIAASFVNDNLDLMKQLDFGDDFISIIKQETAIDAQINLEAVAGDNTIERATEKVYEGIGQFIRRSRDMGRYDIKLDSALLEAKGAKYARHWIEEGLKDPATGDLGIDWKDIVDDKGRYSYLRGEWGGLKDDMAEAFNFELKGKRLGASIDDIAFSQDHLDEAGRFLTFAQERLRMAYEAAGISPDEGDELGDIFQAFDDDFRKSALMHDAHVDILRYTDKWAEGGFDEFVTQMGAAIQKSGSRKGNIASIFNKSFFDLDSTGSKAGMDMAYRTMMTQAYFNDQAQAAGRMDMPSETIRAQQELLTEARQRFDAGGISAASEGRAYGFSGSGRFRKMAEAAAESRGGGEIDKVARMKSLFDDGNWTKLAGSANVKKAGLGLLGLIGGSFAYQATKGRSVEDMEGPDLLPGGSAYEQTSSPDLSYGDGYASSGGGVDYEIRMRGADAQSDMWDGLSSLTGGNVNATMYKSNNRRFDGSYDAVAGSY